MSRSRGVPICNTLLSGARCDCGRILTYLQPVDEAGRALGPPAPLRPHCRTCHQDGHAGCSRCGACMAASGRGSRLRSEQYGVDATRADRSYCSNACRQEAYRRRRRERGQITS